MTVTILVILYSAFSFVYGLNFTIRYNEQTSISCAANITYYVATTPFGCGVLCINKYEEMCVGFSVMEDTCKLCMVGQKTGEEIVLTGNAYVTVPSTNDIADGKIISSFR